MLGRLGAEGTDESCDDVAIFVVSSPVAKKLRAVGGGGVRVGSAAAPPGTIIVSSIMLWGLSSRESGSPGIFFLFSLPISRLVNCTTKVNKKDKARKNMNT